MADKVTDILAKYGEDARSATWAVQGQRVIRHAALERIAAQAGIAFDPPVILRAEKDEAVILVTGRIPAEFHDDPETGEVSIVSPERLQWSIGEALVNVNYRVSGKQAAYPYAMAEKRGKDRVILKLIELHGLLYSEEEADDFRAGKSAPPADNDPEAAVPIHVNGQPVSAYRARKDETWEPIIAELRACTTRAALVQWGASHKETINGLPVGWRNDLRDEYKEKLASIESMEEGA